MGRWLDGMGHSWVSVVILGAAAGAVGCGGTDSASSGGGAGGATTTSSGTTSTVTETTGTMETTTTGCDVDPKPAAYSGQLALFHVNFGETGPDGCLDPMFGGWRYVGLNLDGQDGVNGMNCTPQPDAFPDTLEDGEGGIDNGFSHYAIPIASNYVQLSDQSNTGFIAGAATLAFSIPGLDQLQAGDTVPVGIYVTAPLPPPAMGENMLSLDGTDVLPADQTWLDVDAPTLQLTASFDGQELTGSLDLLVLPLSVSLGNTRFPLYIKVHGAKVVLPLDAERSHVRKGTLAGHLDYAEVFDAIQTVMGSYIPELCTNGTVLDLKSQLRQAQDIRKDGKLTGDCDAISLGVEIEAVSVKVDGMTLVPPPVNPCPPM